MNEPNEKRAISEDIESSDQNRTSNQEAESDKLDDQAQKSEDPSQETEMSSVKPTTREVARSPRSGMAELRQRMLSQPEEGYLAYVQLLDTIDIPPTAGADVVERLEEDTLNLYAAFNPLDPIETHYWPGS